MLVVRLINENSTALIVCAASESSPLPLTFCLRRDLRRIRDSIHQIRNGTQLVENERDLQIDRAKKSLALIDKRRVLSAKAARLEDATLEARRWTQQLKDDMDDSEDGLISHF